MDYAKLHSKKFQKTKSYKVINPRSGSHTIDDLVDYGLVF